MAKPAADDSVFQAIASPTRRALLDALAADQGGASERPVGDLVAALDVTQSAVSQQLAVLKRAGLVTERAAGRFRYYRLRANPLAEVDVWLRRYRGLLERQLDAIGRVLDAMRESRPRRRARRSRAR